MSLSDLILSALLSLAPYKEDIGPEFAEAKRAQLTAVAQAVASASEQGITSRTEWAALVVAVGYEESSFSLRIMDCRCKPLECDRGRARGGWQVHRYAEAIPLWDQMHGLANIDAQARVASARLRRGFYTCKGRGDWVSATLDGFAGARCGSSWQGKERRLATFRRVLKLMGRKAS